MSKNCINCVIRQRTGGDLLCDECRLAKSVPASSSGSVGYLGNNLPAGIIGDPPDVDSMSDEEITAELNRRGIDTEKSFRRVHALLDSATKVKTPPDQLCKWIPRDGKVPERLPCLANRRVFSGELQPCEICAPHLERVRRLFATQNTERSGGTSAAANGSTIKTP